MKKLKPKAWHIQFLANADREKIIQALKEEKPYEITKLAAALARQSVLFADFANQWKLRVSGLDASLSTNFYMQKIYLGRRKKITEPPAKEIIEASTNI